MTTELPTVDEAERVAIIAESRDVHPGRGRAIAACEALWRRGAACTCVAHVPHEAQRVGGGR